MKKRSEIEEKYKWNLSDIYNNEDDLFNDIEKLRTYPKLIEGYKGKLGKPKLCLQYFKLGSELSKLAEKVGAYIGLKIEEDLENSKYLELSKITSAIGKELSVASSFEEDELMSNGEKYLSKLIEDEKFANYRMSLKNLLRNKDHILNESEEKIVSKACRVMGGFSDVYDNIDTLDLKFESALDSKGKKIEVNQHNYSQLLESEDRTLRKNALLSYLKGYHSLSNTIATNYIQSVEADWFEAESYKYPSVLAQSLFGDNINTELYELLLKKVKQFTPLVHRFFKSKKQALGYKDFYLYDRLVPIIRQNEKLGYEDSYKLVTKALQILGDEYVSGLGTAKQDRWIDVYPCEKKTTGGFCASFYFPHPYVLLNTVEDTRSIYTLAHELGHAMHGYLGAKNQPFETADHSIFTGEIASTVNEVLLFKHIYQNCTDDKEKFIHLEKYISNIIVTIFVQTMYSEFEYYAHDLVEHGQPISKDMLNAKYKELTQSYYGKDVKLLPEDIGEGWMRIPHFYRAYYVYKYATGMIAAINFATHIFAGNEQVKEKYLNFLKSGSSDYNLELLKTAGIDMNIDQPYDVMEKELKWATDEMEKLVEKMFTSKKSK